MMRWLILGLWAAPVWAENPMSGAAFDAYTTGMTLSFGTPLNPDFGVEQYLPDRRVIWSPAPGQCVDGVWYELGTNICFVYEGDPTPKCWEIFDTGNGLRAEFTSEPGTTILFESRESVPLVCGDLLS